MRRGEGEREQDAVREETRDVGGSASLLPLSPFKNAFFHRVPLKKKITTSQSEGHRSLAISIFYIQRPRKFLP